MTRTRKRIAVAMSGGTDSTCAAWLLVKAGFDVEGFTLRMLSEDQADAKSCCSLAAVNRAGGFCARMGIRHTVIPVTGLFEERIIADFVRKYADGLTPNPCVVCNREIKFGYLLERVAGLGFGLLATGHYVRKVYDPFGRVWRLARNRDAKKDQSYFLSGLSQDQIRSAVFPLAGYTKEKVRRVLGTAGLNAESLRESQDICFLGESQDYRQFLAGRLNAGGIKKGRFVLPDARVLGPHEGIPFYTPGQRKGLGLAWSVPLYVKRIDPVSGDITVAARDEMLEKSFTVGRLNFAVPVRRPERFMVKIRYQFKPRAVTVRPLSGGRLLAEFKNFGCEIPRGQRAVFYRGDVIAGSGDIE